MNVVQEISRLYRLSTGSIAFHSGVLDFAVEIRTPAFSSQVTQPVVKATETQVTIDAV